MTSNHWREDSDKLGQNLLIFFKNQNTNIVIYGTLHFMIRCIILAPSKTWWHGLFSPRCCFTTFGWRLSIFVHQVRPQQIPISHSSCLEMMTNGKIHWRRGPECQRRGEDSNLIFSMTIPTKHNSNQKVGDKSARQLKLSQWFLNVPQEGAHVAPAVLVFCFSVL